MQDTRIVICDTLERRRRKVRILRGDICVGSIWVSASQDLATRINELLARVGHIHIAPLPVAHTDLAAELL